MRGSSSGNAADAQLAQRPTAGRRAAALATLAFATAVTALPAASARATPRAQAQQQAHTRTVPPRLVGRIDAQELAQRLGVHPGRAAAALRRVDARDLREDPVTALAAEFRLPVATVGLALAAATRHQ